MKVEIKEKMTLKEILDAMQALDDGMVNLSMEEMEQLGSKILDKIDGYKDFLDTCDLRIKYHKDRAKEFAATAKTLENTKKGVETILRMQLDKQEDKRLPGIDWNVVISITKDNKCSFREHKVDPTPLLKIKLPQFINTSYSWDMTKVKQNLQSNEPVSILTSLFKLEDSKSLRWSPRKGVRE